ncbi:MAG: TIGR04211 family SH3 domain-containing protein [Gammaproteobacteria bacterium]|nr:TIGR04211 family SH3 domain-containing protein [Gammaproteobacteria bacterium]
MNSIRLPLIALLLACTGLTHAQTTRYITDQLEVDMRSGQSTQHRIVSMLRSGTSVQVLEEDRDSGWARVRTAQGAEGWVLIRFLDAQPSARDRLARAEQEFARQETALRELREKQREVASGNTELSGKVEELTRTNQAQEQELTRIRRTSANALALDEENRTLKERLSRLERDYQMLEQQTEALRDSSDRDWFMVGAGVLLLGGLIGLIIPKIRWKRKSAWNRF